jgi:hypothetical protein
MAIWIAGDALFFANGTTGPACEIQQRKRTDLATLVQSYTMPTTGAEQGFLLGDYHYLSLYSNSTIYEYQYYVSSAFAASGIQFRLRDTYGQMVDVAKITGTGRFGVGTQFPDETIEAVGNIKATAGQFISTKATGTAPIVVASTTTVDNLSAKLWDGKALPALDNGKYLTNNGTVMSWGTIAGGGDLMADGTVPLTDNWDAGGYEIRALTFESDVATGTAPFTIASTTVVANLNVSFLEGNAAADFEPALGNPGTTGWVLSSTDGGVRSWIAPGGGAASFVDLDDVPAAYAGAGGYVVKVKATADGLEFVAGGAGVSSFTDLDDVPATYASQGGKYLRVKSTEDVLEFVTAPTGGGGDFLVCQVFS